MADLQTAAQQALEAMLNFPDDISDKMFESIVALRAALAQKDEPVQEPVAKVELMTTGGNAGLATRIVEIDDHLRERLRPGQLLYTAPPQRKPETLDEAMRLPRAMAQAYENGYKAGEAHERERCLRLIDDHVRAVDSEDVVRAIKEVQG